MNVANKNGLFESDEMSEEEIMKMVMEESLKSAQVEEEKRKKEGKEQEDTD